MALAVTLKLRCWMSIRLPLDPGTADKVLSHEKIVPKIIYLPEITHNMHNRCPDAG